MSGIDHFGEIHDSVLLSILNRIGDLKTLCRCRAVSKRLNDLVSQVDNVVLKVDLTIIFSMDDGNNLCRFIQEIIYNTILSPRFRKSGYRRFGAKFMPVLKRFSQIRVLKIESSNFGDGKFLKYECLEGSVESMMLHMAKNSIKMSLYLSTNGSDKFDYLKRSVDYCGSSSLSCSTDAWKYLLGIIAEHSKLDCLVLIDTDSGDVLYHMARLQDGSLEETIRSPPSFPTPSW